MTTNDGCEARARMEPLTESGRAVMDGAQTSADRFVKLDEVKRRVGLGKSMIYRLISEGKFPAPYKLSPLASRWSDQEIVDWIKDVKDGFEGKKRKL